MNETATADINAGMGNLILLGKQNQVTRAHVFSTDRQTPTLHS